MMPAAAAAAAVPLSAATVTTLAPALIERWSRLLPLQRGESLLLALDLWARVSPRLTASRLAACGAARPFETALAGCLWVAAKMEECRRGLPNATKVTFIHQLILLKLPPSACTLSHDRATWQLQRSASAGSL